MKKLFFISIMLISVFNLTISAEEPNETSEGLVWYNNLTEAHNMSQKTNKPIFGFFTGSDWCGWCIRLQRNVFAKPAFIEWAKEHVVLLELDFPKRKVLPPEIMQQNRSLQRAFQVRGYPTVWIFTTELIENGTRTSLKAMGSLGYPRGGEPGKEEEVFIQRANQIIGK